MRFFSVILNFLKSFLRSIKNHKKRTLLIGIPLIILAVIFWPRPPKPIETQAVKKADIIESVSTSGTVLSSSSVNLTFLSGGKLTYVGVKKGDHVKKGQVIATLDHRSVQKSLEDDLKDYLKQRNTFDQTQEDNQNRTPQQALNDDMKRILQNNQYDLDKAVISVELQDLAKQQAVLMSPIEGTVTKADVTETGVNITAMTTFTVANSDAIVFQMDIDESDVSKVMVGQEAKVNLNAYPEKTIPLVISSIDFQSHKSETGGNVYTAEANMPTNANFQYRLGMSGDAEIIINKKDAVLVASLASLTDDKAVYVQTKDKNKYEKRKVKTGLQSDTEIEIIDGLKEGEIIALQPDEAAKRTK